MKVSYSDVGEGGVAVICEKTQFFLNTLYLSPLTALKTAFFTIISVAMQHSVRTFLWYICKFTFLFLVLSVFNIVKFNNDMCMASDGNMGVCYLESECMAAGGTPTGKCAKDFGVCCVCKCICILSYIFLNKCSTDRSMEV